MRKKLEYQADQIEHILALHKVPGRVTGGTVTPRWIRYQVIPGAAVKISKIKALTEELAAGLNKASCRISRRGAAIALEFPRDDPTPVRLLPLYDQLTNSYTDYNSIPPATAILGLASDGAPLLIRLSSPDVAHILVAGTTGSGKTVLLQTMIASLAITNTPTDLALLLVDPKQHAFTPFANLPHLARPIISDTEGIGNLLQNVVRLMDHRGAKKDTDPTIVLVIDELADIVMMGDKATKTAITRITQRGREAGIHIVAATQKPTSEILGPLVKANFPVRLVGRVTSAEDARTATGWSGTGAERLAGRGDFIAIAEGRTTRFQVAHATREELESIVKITQRQSKQQQPTLQFPPALAPPDPDQDLVETLIDWEEWATRHHKDKPGYRWGFRSAACKYLFDRDLAGTWERQTKRILKIAEKACTTSTTTVKKPTRQPQTTAHTSAGGRSRNKQVLHAEKATVALNRKALAQSSFTDLDLLLLSGICFCAGCGLLLINVGT